MMQVETYLSVSKIPNAGIGLFSKNFIPKDTIVWSLDVLDNIYTEEEFKSFPLLYQEFLTTYCFMFCKKYILCVDNARFFNHSENPNCYSSDFSENKLGCTRAKKDIHPNEELTDNYLEFGFLESDKIFNSII